MSVDEWSGWWDLNLLLPPSYQADSPCVDCTLEFAALAAGACDGTPSDLTLEERLERRRARRRELRAAA